MLKLNETYSLIFYKIETQLKTYNESSNKYTEDHSYAMGPDLQESLEEWKKEIKKILS